MEEIVNWGDRFLADIDPNYLSRAPSDCSSEIEKLVGALCILTKCVNQRSLALSKKEMFEGNFF